MMYCWLKAHIVLSNCQEIKPVALSIDELCLMLVAIESSVY